MQGVAGTPTHEQLTSMLCVLVPLGSGKSTLLDVLAGRKSKGHMDGQMLFNGRPHN